MYGGEAPASGGVRYHFEVFETGVDYILLPHGARVFSHSFAALDLLAGVWVKVEVWVHDQDRVLLRESPLYLRKHGSDFKVRVNAGRSGPDTSSDGACPLDQYDCCLTIIFVRVQKLFAHKNGTLWFLFAFTADVYHLKAIFVNQIYLDVSYEHVCDGVILTFMLSIVEPLGLIMNLPHNPYGFSSSDIT